MKLRVRPHFCFFFFCFFAGLVLSCSTAGRQEVTEKKQPQHSVLDLLDFGPLLLGRRGATAAAAWPRPGFGSSLGAGPQGVHWGWIACQRCCKFAFLLFLLGPEVCLHADCGGAGNALQASCQLCALRAPLTLGFPPPLFLRLHERLVLLLERLELIAISDVLVCEPLLQDLRPLLCSVLQAPRLCLRHFRPRLKWGHGREREWQWPHGKAKRRGVNRWGASKWGPKCCGACRVTGCWMAGPCREAGCRMCGRASRSCGRVWRCAP